ncbi:MAG: repressor LexA [Methylophaga sp.]|jgi:repressor LexA|uniref:transcriptional repressor LexA n=1 Tax=Methylophaga sp. TaxID=2024840 RepID=UPI000C8D0F92|nr:transcriptional repressor LexA [Methylophaga sp.]MBN45331.1 repressor LexA [Methylophaga sp.]|tara:strand:- start:1886 stop:2485 length:600 start_codon:yes stop_codon:yes gene_type:complete
MLTKRQKDTLEFIRNYINDNGEGPLVAEIAEGLGIQSHGTTHRYINSLIESGHLKRLPLRTRGLKIVEPNDPNSLLMPVMGKIAAGRLIEAVPDESEIDLGEMFRGKGRYVLKISGESMIGKGIMPGDYVVVETGRAAKHGDMIVALVDGYDATLKTLLINEDETFTLQPANDSFEPITLEATRLSIQGVVVGQLRTYP